MSDDSTNVFGHDAFGQLKAELQKREEERRAVRKTIEPVLESLATADTVLNSLSVVTDRDLYRVGLARAQLLHQLADVEGRSARHVTDHK